MSVSKLAYEPKKCDGKYCSQDCDNCTKEHEENTCRLGWWKIWYMGFGSDPMFIYTCSECGHDADKDYNYCPECGALMQKELKE